MKTLDDLKSNWANPGSISSVTSYDQLTLSKIVKSRVSKDTGKSMQYFWASFTLQIIVYALLSHVIFKYWSDTETRALSFSAAAAYLPFTVMLMIKFKQIARTKLVDNFGTSLYQYALTHHALLKSFYRFKVRYEYVLIPFSSAIGVFLTFKLYVPGGVAAHPIGAAITFAITLLSCVIAIRSENRKSFEGPIQNLQAILDEFKVDH